MKGVIIMNVNVSSYLKHAAEYEDTKFSSSYLQKYVIGVLEELNQGKNKGEGLCHALGELSFLYSKKDICTEHIMQFVKVVLNTLSNSNKYIIEHVATFMENILVYNPEMIHFYLVKVKENNKINDDEAAMLYSSVIYSVLENKIDLKRILKHIEYPWRSYFRLANYCLYKNDNINALNYIIKAIKTCPVELKSEYIERRDYIVSNF